ncbi:MAG: valyl-tRNA synthetase [Amphiamblys sp. WSBS2006]|nr:MAG: valyl-tRNA synthetase [Amphiamblys sp. WSBS2006]
MEGETKKELKKQKKEEKQKRYLEKAEKTKTAGKKQTAKPKNEGNKEEQIAEELARMSLSAEKQPCVEHVAEYHPMLVEHGWYETWCRRGYFKPEYNYEERVKNGVFYLPIPPPNVTGALHLGHTVMASIQDVLVRWRRMQQKVVVYLPGCDHAGIATQAVVEKKIHREEGLTAQQLGREEFLKRAWDYKAQYGGRIYEQLKRLGVSVDWDREVFTLDRGMSAAVTEAFVRLFKEGLLKREERLVNWCGKLKTTLSDLEVVSAEIEPAQKMSVWENGKKTACVFGLLFSVAYKIENTDREIVVDTTRPETLFGDVAVAVNPGDDRYKTLVGAMLHHPLTGKKIPVIADEYVDIAFGTGALKITPGHDPNDYQIGKRHGLPMVSILDEDNRLNGLCGEFCGLGRYEARAKVVRHLEKSGCLRGTRPHKTTLPVCSRSGDVIEPRLIPQWWLDCKQMAADAMDAVVSGQLEIIPAEYKKTWFNWLRNIQDWCVSRQLWWGHRIPVYCVHVGGVPTEKWLAETSLERATLEAQRQFPSSPPESITAVQDEDVLDTWFSSGLWPFATLGWPENTLDLQRFYPAALLETGSDILFFWAARMVMLGMHFTGEVPFKKLFLHSIVRDAAGRKMSKSLGNVIDPLHVIEGATLARLEETLGAGNLPKEEVETAKKNQRKEFPNGIPQCGTDALRIGLVSYITTNCTAINLDTNRIVTYKRFGNKVWNVFRYVLSKIDDGFVYRKPQHSLSLPEKWILSCLSLAAKKTSAFLEAFDFIHAVESVYEFWMYQLCDVFVETTKPCLPQKSVSSPLLDTLFFCLEQGLKLLHPFMPFITEELYQQLRKYNSALDESITVSEYPAEAEEFAFDRAEFGCVISVARQIRSLAVKEQKKPVCVRIKTRKENIGTIESQETALMALVRGMRSVLVEGCEEESVEILPAE